VTFHSLRHSQGAILVEQGEHPLVIARRLGHTSVRRWREKVNLVGEASTVP
jgi:hypothetical protein